MEKRENADTKFVKALFTLGSWGASMGPLIYALVVHEWLWLGLIFLGEIGAVVGNVIKQVEN